MRKLDLSHCGRVWHLKREHEKPSDGKGSANALLLAERSQEQFHDKNASVFVFGATGLASTIFTFASVVLKLLQEGFTLTPCFPVLRALFKNLSVSVIVQLSCDHSICRHLFDRGKLSAVSCVSSFVNSLTFPMLYIPRLVTEAPP